MSRKYLWTRSKLLITSALAIATFSFLPRAFSSPLQAQDTGAQVSQDQDDAEAESDEIVVKSELIKELDAFCIRAMETVAEQRPVRAQRMLSDHAKRLTRRMRRGADAYFRVTALVKDRNGQQILTIAEVMGTNERIRAIRAGGEKLSVTLADGIESVAPGDIVQIKGKPIFVSSTSYDDAEYAYGEMDLSDTQIAVKATCEGNAAVILMFEEPVISRVLTEEERKSIGNNRGGGIR